MTTICPTRPAFAIRAALAAACVCTSSAAFTGIADAAPVSVAIAAASAAGDDYPATLRQVLQGTVHYPNSREARHLRAQGTVQVWIELDRAGALLAAGVEQSSGSPLLDDAALQTVRRTHYPALPPASFPGQDSHRFRVPIDFVPNGRT